MGREGSQEGGCDHAVITPGELGLGARKEG